MLQLTVDATQAIERLLQSAGVPAGAGIRIESAGPVRASNGAHAEGGTLRMVVAREAPGGDQILESEGARVFIEPDVVAFVDDKLLDIASDGSTVRFTLAEQ